jgi:acyl-CoA dehydrogenase
LQRRVKERGLWACHLGPALGGPGYGQLRLALMNEILGRSRWAPTVFGCQAPDSGNGEILAHFGTAAQKERYLRPLLDGELSSCYAMTEPQAGADPTLLRTRAVRDGGDWVIAGEKWFSSNASVASFFIVMAVTDPDVSPYQGMSMFVVPAETPGVHLVREVHTNAGTGTEGEHHSSHGYLRFDEVRVPAESLLGAEGAAFAIAQTRLGGGRIHHAMRTIAQVRQAFDMMCERALSRDTRNGTLATLQMTQERVAEGFAQAFGPKVRVNTIQAGPFLTDISANWTPGLRQEMEARVALGRCAEADEIVGATLFFATSASSFCTGSILRVDGGWA